MNPIKTGLIATSLALAPFALIAHEKDSSQVRTPSQQRAVEQLKDELPFAENFEVRNILTTREGLTCITYHTSDDGTGQRWCKVATSSATPWATWISRMPGTTSVSRPASAVRADGRRMRKAPPALRWGAIQAAF